MSATDYAKGHFNIQHVTLTSLCVCEWWAGQSYSHQCSGPWARIYQIQKTFLAFHRRDTPPGGSQTPGKTQKERFCSITLLLLLLFLSILILMPESETRSWRTTDPNVKCFLCCAFQLLFDLLWRGQLQQLFNFTIRQTCLLCCLQEKKWDNTLTQKKKQPINGATSSFKCSQVG